MFTRSFNKAGHLSHYASAASAKKRLRSQGEEWEEEGAESGEERESVVKNPMIKALKITDKESGGKGRGGGHKGAHNSGSSKKAKQTNGGKIGKQNDGGKIGTQNSK